MRGTTHEIEVGFLGAGKMAEGILSAIPSNRRGVVLMCDRDRARLDALEAKYGIRTTTSPEDVVSVVPIVFLAVRPQDVDGVASVVKPLLGASTTLVSIVAGKTLAKLRHAFGAKVKLVRVMPNLALRAGAGMCAVCPGCGATKSAVARVIEILGGAGETVILSERHFDAVTALSGSGPAYFAYMEKAMAAGGVSLGLPPKVARLLAGQTMYGTAKFLRESGIDLDEFIAGVCTKGGTTAAGMKYLSKPVFAKVVADTLRAAAERSKELA